MDLAAQIKSQAENLLHNPNLFVVDVTAVMKRKPGKIVVTLDGDQGATIEDCAELSRKLSDVLDANAELADNYLLEVSSPGVDQPLKMHRQYVKNIGRVIKVKLKEENKHEEGTLLRVTNEEIVLGKKSGKGKKAEQLENTILFENIEKAIVTISFK
ncbi:MAG: ribosome maturation factor RimP [Cyclobacteriaceae bacterium]|jgi:ribosome maturation factor RimP|nr:ribosome maturation factor RimP [Flammeovirgaceae bacterium]MCZ8023150.1 ribosome maturation factor RimP [Cytophagales bacterium]MCZ8329224.1 ribosome maturation factor RimP [Cyclobacteriaceae bacterium]